MTLRPATPLATAQIAAAGCALMVLAYPLSFLPFPSSPGDTPILHALWVARSELLTVFVPFILGFVLSWRYSSLFTKGVRTDIWTQDQLDRAHAFLQSAPIRSTQRILILAFLAFLVFSVTRQHDHHTSFTYAFLYALNPITAMRRALSPPWTPIPRNHIDWSQAAPIHSNHWGHPPASA